MADIFLSYSPFDIEKASKIAGALERRGSSVSWRRNEVLDTDEALRLDEEIAAASWIVVLWSSNALQDGRITFEAMQANDANKLISVELAPNSIPPEFSNADNPQLMAYQEQLTGILQEVFSPAQEVSSLTEAPETPEPETAIDNKKAASASNPDSDKKDIAVDHKAEAGVQVVSASTDQADKIEEMEKIPQVGQPTQEDTVENQQIAQNPASEKNNGEAGSGQENGFQKTVAGKGAVSTNLGQALERAQALEQRRKSENNAPEKRPGSGLSQVSSVGEGGRHIPPGNPMQLRPASTDAKEGSGLVAGEGHQQPVTSQGAGKSLQTDVEQTVSAAANNKTVVSSSERKKGNNFLVPAGLVLAGVVLLSAVGGGYYYMATTPPQGSVNIAGTSVSENRERQAATARIDTTAANSQNLAEAGNETSDTGTQGAQSATQGEDPILAQVLSQIPQAPAANVQEAPKTIIERIAEANVERGKRFAVTKCEACHSFEKNGPTKAGPNLYNVIGQLIGSTSGYEYSDTLRSMGAIGEVWSFEQVECYLKDPEACMPGTHMSFSGIRRASQRADIIAYLKHQSN